MFYIGLYRDNMEKIVLSETVIIRRRALIFGMYHDLVNLYQVCSNYTPGAKIGPTPGVTRDTASFQPIPMCNLKQNSG